MVTPTQINLDDVPASLRMMRPSGNVVRRDNFTSGVNIMTLQHLPPIVPHFPNPQFTLGGQEAHNRWLETYEPPPPRLDPYERIENGTLLSADAQQSLRPSPSPRDVTPNELDEIRQIAVTAGAHIHVRGSWTYDFHLYNSPTQGLILVYRANMSGSEGWYPTTMEEVERFCCVHV